MIVLDCEYDVGELDEDCVVANVCILAAVNPKLWCVGEEERKKGGGRDEV